MKPQLTEKRHECIVCHKRFSKSKYLTNHRRVHTGEKLYECHVCGKKFTTSTLLKRHGFRHTGDEPFECNVCRKRFVTSTHLKIHALTHTGEKPFECNICKNRFYTSYHLKRHVLTHTGEKPFECTVCKKKFSTSTHLKRHAFTHTGEKPFECKVCQKKFTLSDNLKRHKLTHTKEVSLKCSVCFKKFTRLDKLRRHSRTHMVENPYKCNLCKESFRNLSALRFHREQIHNNGGWPQQCLFCQKGFSCITELNRPLLDHIGEKPFFCNLCGNEFKAILSRDFHILNRHDGLQSSNLGETRISIEYGNIESSSEDSSSTDSDDDSQECFSVTIIDDDVKANTNQDLYPTTALVKKFLEEGSGVLVISTWESSITCERLTDNIRGMTVFHKPDNFFNSTLSKKALVCGDNFENNLMRAAGIPHKGHILVVTVTEQNISEKVRRLFRTSCEAGTYIKVVSNIIEFNDFY